MPIEAASFISDLILTNPLGSDERNTADDHLRLIKSVLKGQFPNFTAVAMNATVGELNVLAGVTASTAELNILVGVLASAAQINFLTVAAGADELNKAVVQGIAGVNMGPFSHRPYRLSGTGSAYTMANSKTNNFNETVYIVTPPFFNELGATLKLNAELAYPLVFAETAQPLDRNAMQFGNVYTIKWDSNGFWHVLDATIPLTVTRVHRNGVSQAISFSFLKVLFTTRSFDPLLNYDITTNFRYTATSAGYFNVYSRLTLSAAVVGDDIRIYIYKNGASISERDETAQRTTPTLEIQDLVYMNGTTDYIEIFVGNFTRLTSKVSGLDSYLTVTFER